MDLIKSNGYNGASLNFNSEILDFGRKTIGESFNYFDWAEKIGSFCMDVYTIYSDPFHLDEKKANDIVTLATNSFNILSKVGEAVPPSKSIHLPRI